MKIYLKGIYAQQASENSMYGLKFSMDYPPHVVMKDDLGYYFEGTEDHLKRLGENATLDLRADSKKSKKETLVNV